MTLALSTRGYLGQRGRAVKAPRRAPGTITAITADRVASVTLSGPTVPVPAAPVPLGAPSVEVSIVHKAPTVTLTPVPVPASPAPPGPLAHPTVTVTNIGDRTVILSR